jgi:RimJ/RimL family protein N-acetyltransferase
MKVRDLRWSDFDALVEIYYHLYDERAAGEPIGIHLLAERPPLADEVSWFSGHYRKAIQHEIVARVAEEDGRAVGSCTIGRVGLGADSELGHVGELGILVDHRHRGQGAGTALLKDALAQARGMFEIVRLTVFADNARAIRLYESLGFQKYGTLPRAIRRGDRYIDEVFMYLDFGADPARGNPNR